MNLKLLILSVLLALVFCCGATAADDAAFPSMPTNTIAGTLTETILSNSRMCKLADDVQLTAINLIVHPVILDLNGHNLSGTD